MTTTPPATTPPTAAAPAEALGQPLLRPVICGDLRLANRVVMAPLTRARAANEALAPTDLHAEYYGRRAGAGLIVTEGTWVSEGSIGFPHVPGIYSPRQIDGWRRVTDAVHARGGRIVLQLWHSGSTAHPDHRAGTQPAGPSAVNPRERTFTARGFQETGTPREMTAADIADTVADYGTAAEHARRAGFDGVEVHAVGSCLLSQFLNPRLNHRTDAYGGGPAGRRRLLLDVVDAVAAPWDGRRAGVRLSPYWSARDLFGADERAGAGYPFTADAETLADYDALVAELDQRPVAYLHLRGPVPAVPGGAPDVTAFARYRQLFGGPLIANHGFDRTSGNALLAAGLADAVSFGTPFIANPDLVTRFARNQPLAAGDPATYYTGGARGYTDYPDHPAEGAEPEDGAALGDGDPSGVVRGGRRP